jgi:hypothetical protein
VDDADTSTPTLPPNVTTTTGKTGGLWVGDGPINPTALKIETTPQTDGSALIKASSDSAVGTWPNTVVQGDFDDPSASYFGSYDISTIVLAGIVDPSKPGTIKQYNTAFNLASSVQPNIYGHKTSGVYKEKHYTGGSNSYYPDALGGFDVLIGDYAAGEPSHTSKIITLNVTQDGVTKTYIIDYRDVIF